MVINRLPAEYQEVEYLENTSTQWIDTGVVPTPKTVSQIKFMNLVVTGNVIYGMFPKDTTDYRFFNFSSRIYFDLPKYISNATGVTGARIYGSGNSCVENKIYEFELGNYYVKDIVSDEILVSGDPIADFEAAYTLKLNRKEAGTVSLNRWYYVKIFENAVPVRNLVPCYRKSDSEPGMYDTVSKTFYTNSGTGTFLVGNDVNYSTVNLMESRRRILLNTPHIKSLSGNALSFRTDVPFEMKECKIHFAPKQEGTGTPSPDNVRPITGWDGVTIKQTGRNLCPAANGFEIRNWEYYSQARKYVITGLPPNTPMTLSITVTKGLGTSSGRRLYLIGKTSAFIDTGTIGQKSLTVNTNDNGNITISQNNTMLNTDEYAEVLQNIQLEFGSVATDFEPYQATTLTIPFPQTIYGGYVDLVKGEVVETQTKVTLDGVTNKCTYGSYTGTYFYGAGWVYSNPLGLNFSQAPHDNFLCDKLPHLGSNGQTMHYSAVSSGKLYYVFRVLEKSDYPDGLTNTQVKDLTNAWLQENPVDVVYPLATPNTYPLTDPPSVPSTLRGLNNITTTANGNIDVSFCSH